MEINHINIKNTKLISDEFLNDKLALAIERGKRIRMLRALSGLSRKQFQEQLNVSISTLNIWENGRICLTKKGALRISIAVKEVGIECSTEWLLSGLGNPPRQIKNSNPDNSSTSDPDGYGEINCFLKNHSNAIYATISDELMAPFFNIGDIVAGPTVPIAQIKSLLGNIVIIELSGKTILRRITSIIGDRCHLNCCNASIANDNFTYVDINDIIRIAKVLLHRSF